MSQHDNAVDRQAQLFAAIRGLVTEDEIRLVERFAEGLGVTAVSYCSLAREYRMSDGETYSLGAIRQHMLSEHRCRHHGGYTRRCVTCCGTGFMLKSEYRGEVLSFDDEN